MFDACCSLEETRNYFRVRACAMDDHQFSGQAEKIFLLAGVSSLHLASPGFEDARRNGADGIAHRISTSQQVVGCRSLSLSFSSFPNWCLTFLYVFILRNVRFCFLFFFLLYATRAEDSGLWSFGDRMLESNHGIILNNT
ncbi:hypothetical protein CDAR_38651 [Caerostris darwini]|uniref:Uncharacterized protein n=1 Tax=Caerostris darwini TaxID=1538125 RepID=A0AAV4UQX7_9ARAC|nr:hypothetical protein CDAR_38651 [Caerostris darwini]